MAQFDFHFHLLFKHAVSGGRDVNKDIDVKGFADLLDKVFGGPFESQSSPQMVLRSPLKFGVISLLAIEHAFVRKMLKLPGFRLDRALPIDQEMIKQIRDSKVSYHQLFQDQLKFTLETMANHSKQWNMHLLNRSEDADGSGVFAAIREKANSELQAALDNGAAYNGSRCFALSIEGGHNLSEVLIRNNEGAIHQTPEETLKRLQDRDDVDFISINLCHLSRIPEQPLAGFAQGLNKSAQKAFNSPDFYPSVENGISVLGRKVIRQALTHPTKPILIDVKHMSLYSRLQYYRFREKLIRENETVARLPIISSHTGFTFNTYSDFINKQQYQPEISVDKEYGTTITRIEALERQVGETDDRHNEDLFCNPWTINLFDEELVEIYNSNGLIDISLDQRVLGTRKMFIDGKRGLRYEGEHLAQEEYIKLFQNRQIPTEESWLGDLIRKTAPLPRERHSMLLALHLVHAVRVGLNAGFVGYDDGSGTPWDFLCIGSDFDGLINPINAVQNVTQIGKLKGELIKYLPQADKTLPFYEKEKALRYTANGNVDRAYLELVIDKVLSKNGIRFLKRFINNWAEEV